MRLTRSQKAAEVANEKAQPITKGKADASVKIQKNKGTKQVNEKPAAKKTPAKNSASKQSPPKEFVYESDMVNIEQFIKKFDIEAVLDQTGNSIGDSHLPRGKYFCALIYKNSI